MKKVILAAAALFVLNTISAQEPTPVSNTKGKGMAHPKKEQGMKKEKETAEQRAQKAVEKIDKAVTLTEDQKPKIYDLALNRAKSVDAVREKYKGQKEKHKEMGSEIQDIRKKFRQDVKAILTPEQLEKAKATAKANKANKGGKKGEEAADALDTQD